jgi:hypothetical protein
MNTHKNVFRFLVLEMVFLIGLACTLDIPNLPFQSTPVPTPENWECFTQEITEYANQLNPIVEQGKAILEEANNHLSIEIVDLEGLKVHTQELWDVVNQLEAITPPPLFAEFHQAETAVFRLDAQALDDKINGDEYAAHEKLTEAADMDEMATAEKARIDEFCGN